MAAADQTERRSYTLPSLLAAAAIPGQEISPSELLRWQWVVIATCRNSWWNDAVLWRLIVNKVNVLGMENGDYVMTEIFK